MTISFERPSAFSTDTVRSVPGSTELGSSALICVLLTKYRRPVFPLNRTRVLHNTSGAEAVVVSALAQTDRFSPSTLTIDAGAISRSKLAALTTLFDDRRGGPPASPPVICTDTGPSPTGFLPSSR